MKKLILALLILTIPVLAFGQFTLLHKTITVTLDNGTDSANVWQAFSSARYSFDHSTSVIDPPDVGGFVGNITAYIYVDSVKATKPTLDSLAWGMLRTDHTGTPIGDTLWVVANADVFQSATLSYTRTYNAWRLRNRASPGANHATWIDLRGEFEDWLGIKHLFYLADTGVDDSLQVNLHTNQLR